MWDTMYAEYLLTAQNVLQGAQMTSDGAVARYTEAFLPGSSKISEAETKEILQSSPNVHLMHHLQDTLLAFQRQTRAAVVANQALIIESKMDVVLATTEMEYNGIFVDALKGRQQHEELKREISVDRSNLNTFLPSTMPRWLWPSFNWLSSKSLHAYFFGGTIDLIGGHKQIHIGDVSIPLEIAMLSGNPLSSQSFRTTYAVPFFNRLGLSCRGTVENTRNRLEKHMKDRTFDTIGLIICGMKGFLNLMTGKYMEYCVLADSESLYSFLAGNSEQRQKFTRVVFLGPRNIRSHVCSQLQQAIPGIFHNEKTHDFASEDSFSTQSVTGEIIRFPFCFADAEKLFDSSTSCIMKSSKKVIPNEREIPRVDVRLIVSRLRKLCTERTGLHMKKPSHLLREALLALGQTVASKYDAFSINVAEIPSAADPSSRNQLQNFKHFRFESLLEKLFGTEETRNIIERYRSKEGFSPMSKAFLEFLRSKDVKVAAKLLHYRSQVKIFSAYYETMETGMLSMVHCKDHCIHHSLSTCRTVTGRLTSHDPNCQSIPKKGKLREIFTSRFWDGLCVEVDYKQLEVVVLAALSRDPNLIRDLKSGVDIHTKRITMMLPEYSYDEAYQKARVRREARFIDLRNKAKTFQFQKQYGAGPRRISETTGLSMENVLRLNLEEDTLYAAARAFFKHVQKTVANTKPGELQGMHPMSCPDEQSDAGTAHATKDMGGHNGKEGKTQDKNQYGEFRLATGTRFVFAKSHAEPFSVTQMRNYPIQGLAGEIVHVMLGGLWRHFVSMRNYDGSAFLVNTVHDSIWIDVRPHVLHRVCRDTKKILSSVQKVFNALFPELDIPLDFEVDVTVGSNMATLVPIEKFQC